MQHARDSKQVSLSDRPRVSQHENKEIAKSIRKVSSSTTFYFTDSCGGRIKQKTGEGGVFNTYNKRNYKGERISIMTSATQNESHHLKAIPQNHDEEHERDTLNSQQHRHSANCLLPVPLEQGTAGDQDGEGANTAGRENRYFKATVVLLVLLFTVTITQGVLAWYGTSNISCKKTTRRSATLAPQFLFGIAIAEILFSSSVILITFTRRARENTRVCANTRLMVKIVTVCLVALLLVYLGLIAFVELFSEEYEGCKVKKVFLKVQAVLTVVQICLFIVLGNL